MSQKEKFALYLTPEMKARLERRYTEDGSRSLTGFIENAINFYLDYLSANNAGMFLPASVQSYLDGRLDQLENRMSSLLYKQAVTLDTVMSTPSTFWDCCTGTAVCCCRTQNKPPTGWNWRQSKICPRLNMPSASYISLMIRRCVTLMKESNG